MVRAIPRTGMVGVAVTPRPSANKLPRVGSDEPTRGYPDYESDDCDGGGVPGDGRADLSVVEPERSQEGEVFAASSYGGAEGVSDRNDRERCEQRSEDDRVPVDLTEPVDLHGCCRFHDSGVAAEEVRPPDDELGYSRDPTVDLRLVGSGGVAGDEEGAVLMRIEQRGEARSAEHGGVGEGLVVGQRREHGAPDDAVFVFRGRAGGLDGVTDVFVERLERHFAERDFVGAAWRPAVDDGGSDAAAQCRDRPSGRGSSVDLEVFVTDFGDSTDAGGRGGGRRRCRRRPPRRSGRWR